MGNELGSKIRIYNGKNKQTLAVLDFPCDVYFSVSICDFSHNSDFVEVILTRYVNSRGPAGEELDIWDFLSLKWCRMVGVF